MTPPTTPSAPSAFPSDDDLSAQPWWGLILKPSEILSVIAIIAALIAVLGWRFSSPAAALTALESRTSHLERRVDTLFDNSRFQNYLLCVQMRRNDPAALPPDCAPIIEAQRGRP